MKKLQLQSAVKSATNNFDIEKAKGRPMLQWVGKKPLDKIEYYPAQEKEIYGDKKSKNFNKLFWGIFSVSQIFFKCNEELLSKIIDGSS